MDIKIQLLQAYSKENYEALVRITVSGNSSASREKLINQMKKEAAQYHADGIILLDEKRIARESLNGFALAINIVSLFGSYESCEEATYLPVEQEYQALKMEGIAFRYK
ncbi:MAG: ABC-type phosphate transport system ATPase subunit [Polaribacter sp.]|jgi:ABC-type phosphate transport system ATPase subunit